MPLIPDNEANDILTRLGQLENIIAGMAKRADIQADLLELTTGVQEVKALMTTLQTRQIDLKSRYETLASRVAALEA